MNKIFFRPIGDKNTASSRLRVWNIQPFIKDSVVGIADEYLKGDVLIIQKVPDIDELRKAKSQGAKVIYDIDDRYETQEFLDIIKEADLITTDSKLKKEWLSNYNKRVEIIPDSLDWNGEEYKGNKNGVIGWVGYGNNSQYLNDIKDKIPKEFRLRLITDISWLQYIKTPAENIQNRPWSLEKVDQYLSECEMSVCYLPNNDFELCKGEHKLLKSLAIGIPTFTSPTPSYVDVFEKAGVGDKYVIKNIDDWKNIKNIGFDSRLKEYAMQFEAEKIAKIWRSVILKV